MARRSRDRDALLAFVAAHHQLHGVAPTYRDMRVPIRTVSTSQVTFVLRSLRHSGLVRWVEGSSRTVVVTPRGQRRLDAVLPHFCIQRLEPIT